MKRRIVPLLFFLCLLVPILTISAFADFGPKPSVVIDFSGADGEAYYVALLSDSPSGPYFVVEAGDTPESGVDEKVWQKFVSYEDPDGMEFLGELQLLSGDDTYLWSYYPPSQFRVVVYFPETDTFAAGDALTETYAFDSYYKVDLAGLSAGGGSFSVARRYNYIHQALAFLLRLIVTIGIELLLAPLFGFRAKKQLLVILIANTATQLVLNGVMLFFGYPRIFVFYVIEYFILELGIMVIEMIVYRIALPRLAEKDAAGSGRPIRYALLANLCSFGLGYIASGCFPMLFS